MWLDEPAVRALAIVLQCDIFVIPPIAPITYYPKQLGIYGVLGTTQTFDLSTEPSIGCLDTSGNTFIPDSIFNNDSVVICHNHSVKQGHFWCTQSIDNNATSDWIRYKLTCPLPVRTLVRL